ncbi:Ferritin-like domain protein [Phycisphaerae bacterium RAS1]|nr:Ferritin-like domain protein [Phycisphaerae bacterium RAS1]
MQRLTKPGPSQPDAARPAAAAAGGPGIEPDELIADLNRLYAEEVEAAVRYLHLSSAVRGMDRLLVEGKLKEGFQETIQHAEIIAQKLRALGAVPKLEINVECPPQAISGREALRFALTFEEAALEAYQDVLRRVEGDVVLEEFIRGQIAVESVHVAELKELIFE